MSDVVAPYCVSQLSETAKLCSTFHNKATKKRGYYLCPIKQGATPISISGGDLVEKAGLKMEEVPKNWDGVWTPTSSRLRRRYVRRECGRSTPGFLRSRRFGPNDGNNLFRHFLIANGGEGIVTPDGKLPPTTRRFAKRRSSLSSS